MTPRPFNLDAERALLGGLLTMPQSIVDVAGVVAPHMFYRPDHSALFALLMEMQASGEVVDLVTLPRRVMGDDKGQRFGGVAYVLELPERCPATANLGHYANDVAGDWRRRVAIDAGEAMVAAIAAGSEPADAMAKLERLVGAMDNGAAQWTTYGAEADAVLEDIAERERVRKAGGTPHPSTGYPEIDRLIAGLMPGRLYILAARPAMGKSALAQGIANNRAAAGDAVLMHSMEMGRGQLVERGMAQEGGFDASRARDGYLAQGPDGWDLVHDGHEAVKAMRVIIDDRPSLTIEQITASAKYHQAKHGIRLLVVDYLQLIEGRGDRRHVVEAASRGLKKIAAALHLPVLALSQLSRGVEQRPDKRPLLADLRETGAIEQDADAVLMLYRDAYYETEAPSTEAEVIVRKARNGTLGTAYLTFDGPSVRFRNRSVTL